MKVHPLPLEQNSMDGLPIEWTSSPFSKFLNVELDARGDDIAFSLNFKKSFMGNPSLEAFHGGIVATFIETCAQLYFGSATNEEGLQQAETFTVDFLRPSVASEGPLLAVPTIVRQGKNVSILSVTVFQKEKMVATGKAIFVADREK